MKFYKKKDENKLDQKEFTGEQFTLRLSLDDTCRHGHGTHKGDKVCACPPFRESFLVCILRTSPPWSNWHKHDTRLAFWVLHQSVGSKRLLQPYSNQTVKTVRFPKRRMISWRVVRDCDRDRQVCDRCSTRNTRYTGHCCVDHRQRAVGNVCTEDPSCC